MRLVVVLAAVTGGACLSTPGPAATDAQAVDAPMRDTATACVDLDQDGWFTCGAYPDCFDDDGTRHPGAFEPGSADDHDCNPIANLPPRSRVTVDLVGRAAPP